MGQLIIFFDNNIICSLKKVIQFGGMYHNLKYTIRF